MGKTAQVRVYPAVPNSPDPLIGSPWWEGREASSFGTVLLTCGLCVQAILGTRTASVRGFP